MRALTALELLKILGAHYRCAKLEQLQTFSRQKIQASLRRSRRPAASQKVM